MTIEEAVNKYRYHTIVSEIADERNKYAYEECEGD